MNNNVTRNSEDKLSYISFFPKEKEIEFIACRLVKSKIRQFKIYDLTEFVEPISNKLSYLILAGTQGIRIQMFYITNEILQSNSLKLNKINNKEEDDGFHGLLSNFPSKKPYYYDGFFENKLFKDLNLNDYYFFRLFINNSLHITEKVVNKLMRNIRDCFNEIDEPPCAQCLNKHSKNLLGECSKLYEYANTNAAVSTRCG